MNQTVDNWKLINQIKDMQSGTYSGLHYIALQQYTEKCMRLEKALRNAMRDIWEITEVSTDRYVKDLAQMALKNMTEVVGEYDKVEEEAEVNG
jgi:hypothetical protein